MVSPERQARERIALNARRLRLQRGWTQARAAESIDCAVQHIRRIESARTDASIGLLARMAQVYGADVRDLFSPAGEWAPRPKGRPRKAKSVNLGQPKKPKSVKLGRPKSKPVRLGRPKRRRLGP